MNLTRITDLPLGGISREFVGDDHAAPISIYFVDAPPGRGPVLHKHPYVETIIILEGTGKVTIGDEEGNVTAGDIAVIPPETPHKFVNIGPAMLRQIDVHGSPRFIQTDLE